MEVSIEKFNLWGDSLISDVLLVILGIIMVVLQSESLDIILIIAGILFLIMGTFTLYDGYMSGFTPMLVIGVSQFVLGLALVFLTELLENALMALLALGLIVFGLLFLIGLRSGFTIAKESRTVSMIVGLLIIVMGVYALLNLEETADMVMIIIGAFTLITGLLRVYEFYQLRKVSH